MRGPWPDIWTTCKHPQRLVLKEMFLLQFRKSFLRRIGCHKNHRNENNNDIRQLPLSHVIRPNQSVVYRDNTGEPVALTNMSVLSNESSNVVGCFGKRVTSECSDYYRQDMRIRMLMPCWTIPFVRKKYTMKTRSTHNLRAV